MTDTTTTTELDQEPDEAGETETDEDLHPFKIVLPKQLYLDIMQHSVQGGVDHMDLFAFLIGEGWRARCEGFTRPVRKIQHGIKVRLVTTANEELLSVVLPELPAPGEIVRFGGASYVVNGRSWFFDKEGQPTVLVGVEPE